AESNLSATASALKARSHAVGLLHGPPTGAAEAGWRDIFPERFPLTAENPSLATRDALTAFEPDAVYVHKMSDLAVLEMLANSGRPVVRMVHDHDLCCMRSYKYFPLTRNICTRAAGPACVFPCGAVLARDRHRAIPVRWISYRAK